MSVQFFDGAYPDEVDDSFAGHVEQSMLDDAELDPPYQLMDSSDALDLRQAWYVTFVARGLGACPASAAPPTHVKGRAGLQRGVWRGIVRRKGGWKRRRSLD